MVAGTATTSAAAAHGGRGTNDTDGPVRPTLTLGGSCQPPSAPCSSAAEAARAARSSTHTRRASSRSASAWGGVVRRVVVVRRKGLVDTIRAWASHLCRRGTAELPVERSVQSRVCLRRCRCSRRHRAVQVQTVRR
eukprot:scaffold23518_cov20-Phaeocystis_antarctica.AAC.1